MTSLDDKIVVLHQFSNLADAELARNRLMRNNIPAFIANHNGATMLPIPAIKISLHVNHKDVDRALKILQEWESQADSYDPDFREASHEDIEFEKSLFEQRKGLTPGKEVYWFFLLIGIVVLFLLLSRMR